jgi:regulatory protein
MAAEVERPPEPEGDRRRVARLDGLPAAAPAGQVADLGAVGDARHAAPVAAVAAFDLDPVAGSGAPVAALEQVRPVDRGPATVAGLDGVDLGAPPAPARTVDLGPPRAGPPRAGSGGAPSDERPLRRGGAAEQAGRGEHTGKRRRAADSASRSVPEAIRARDGVLDPDADPVAVAREICLRLLTDRARTRHELATALRRKGVPDDAAGQVLGRFDEVGLIDDAAFAGQWVRSRHRFRGLGRRAIAQELRRKGVDDDVAGEALAEVDSAAEEQRARQLVDRKLRSLRADTSDERAVAARRLVGMLARKGYGAGVAYAVVRAALAARGAEDDELGTEPPTDD